MRLGNGLNGCTIERLPLIESLLVQNASFVAVRVQPMHQRTYCIDHHSCADPSSNGSTEYSAQQELLEYLFARGRCDRSSRTGDITLDCFAPCFRPLSRSHVGFSSEERCLATAPGRKKFKHEMTDEQGISGTRNKNRAKQAHLRSTTHMPRVNSPLRSTLNTLRWAVHPCHPFSFNSASN